MPQAYRKDFLQNVIHYDGQVLRWESVGPSTGVRRVEDAALIAFLDDLADKKRKGVRRISPEQYDSIKKNTKRAKSPSQPFPQVRVFNQESVLPSALKVSSDAQPVARPPAPVFTQRSAPIPPPPPVPTAPPAPTPAPVAPTAPPVKPRTMKKSQLKEKEAEAPK